MNAAAHQVADQRKDLAMPRNGALPGERGRDKQKPKMAAIAAPPAWRWESSASSGSVTAPAVRPLAQQAFEIIAWRALSVCIRPGGPS